MTIKISAVIPAYNSAQFILDAIASIKRQSRTIDEIIVIDDGSSDNTQEIISRLKDPGIRYFKQFNQGPSAARNRGIQMAEGDWIAFLDADDQWTSNKIELQLKALERSPELMLIAGDMAEIDIHDHIITESVLAKHNQYEFFKNLDGLPLANALSSLLKKNFIPTGTVLIHRNTVINAGLFNEKIRFGEDLELWAKIAAKHPITCLPSILMLRRQHANNATQMTENMLKDLVKVMESVKNTCSAELKEQRLDPDLLVARHYAELGYWYFSQARYEPAKAAFKSSLTAKVNKRAAIYYCSSYLPKKLIALIKLLKSSY